jgi:methylenetetrahydrofolate dehydrogenase (NADP+)/methenyltetrahydrofolate cyclohydrolase
MNKIIDGKAIAAEIRQELKQRVEGFKELFGFKPGLAVILVGTDPASRVYVNNKRKACEEIGYESYIYEFPAEITEEHLLKTIYYLNGQEAIHGILVQLPLPKHIDEKKILYAIKPTKDVDAFHPRNVGLLTLGTPVFKPCTPAGVMELLKRSNIDITGKECVIVGRSNIVGKPLAMMLLQANGTVTVCHSKTENLSDVTHRADILITAIGKPEFFTEEYIKPGAVVIDVGINRKADGKLVGDVAFNHQVLAKVSAITPVPGGCGPMTIAMLMQNTFDAAMMAASKASNGEFTYNLGGDV